MSFEATIDEYIFRVDAALAKTLPARTIVPQRLHDAMHYATLNGGKRIRPLLVYATGEVIGVDVSLLDAPAVAVELIHAFSLVHDDLPAMDDDDLRRGRPTVHREFDEATAILAADALQPLAFEVLAGKNGQAAPAHQLAMVRILARACGSLGMTGGQAIDIESEGQAISSDRLQMMFEQKTGALIEAAVHMAAANTDTLSSEQRAGLAGFARNLGLAFQIRDDLLEIEGDTETIGKSAGSDAANDKATWPAVHGIEQARADCERLYEEGIGHLAVFAERGEPLSVLAKRIVWRKD